MNNIVIYFTYYNIFHIIT